MLSGIKSLIDTNIIIAAANDNDETIILLGFLFFINIIIVPIKVENPAIDVNKKENNILFTLSPIKYMKNGKFIYKKRIFK